MNDYERMLAEIANRQALEHQYKERMYGSYSDAYNRDNVMGPPIVHPQNSGRSDPRQVIMDLLRRLGF